MSNDCSKQFDLSISAITLVKKSSGLSLYQKRHHRRSRLYPSTIIKRIELKYLLYSTRAMKTNKQRQYTDKEMKIYVV